MRGDLTSPCPATKLKVYRRVTRLTQRYEVDFLVRTAFRERFAVVDVLRGNGEAVTQTHLTQRVCRYVPLTYRAPCLAVAL